MKHRGSSEVCEPGSGPQSHIKGGKKNRLTRILAFSIGLLCVWGVLLKLRDYHEMM